MNLSGDGFSPIYLHHEVAELAGSPDSEDRFGAALAKGFFDQGSELDLAIGIPGEDGAGAVAIIYNGGATVSPRENESWSARSLLGTQANGAEFGATLAAGDFDGDGWDDLAIGAPGTTFDGARNAGLVMVVYGTAEGLDRERMQIWHQGIDLPDTPNTGDRFGASLVAANLGENGFDDLAIGVPYESVDGQLEAGAVHVLYGTRFGLAGEESQFWHQGANDGTRNLGGTPDEGDHFGFSLAAGDLNGDLQADLAIGTPGETVAGQIDAGSVSVLYGRRLVPLSTGGSDLIHQGFGGLEGEAESGDMFGYALAIGNFLHDGHGDLAVGVPGQVVNDAAAAGAVHLVPGEQLGLNVLADEIWHQNLKGLEQAEAGDRFGSVLAAGNLTKYADRNDLLVGVPQEDLDGLADVGVVHVIRTDGTEETAWSHAQTLRPSTYGLVEHQGEKFGSALLSGLFDPFPRVSLYFNPEELLVGIPYDRPSEGDVDGGAVVGGDAIRPSVTITRTPNVLAFCFDIDFSEYVTDFTREDVLLTGPPGAELGPTLTRYVQHFEIWNQRQIAPGTEGSFFQVLVRGMQTIGEITVRVPENAAFDQTGNANLPSNVAASFYDERVRTRIRLLDRTEEDPIDEARFEVSISQLVNSFTAEHVELGDPVGPAQITVKETGEWGVYIVTVKAESISQLRSITVFPDVLPNTVRATERFPVPVVPVPASATAKLSYRTTDEVVFRITFDQQVSGLESDDLVIGGTAEPSRIELSTEGDAYIAKVTGMTRTGTVTLRVPEGVVATDGGLSNLEAGVVNAEYWKELVRVEVRRREDESTEEQVVFDVTFDEPVVGLEPEDFAFEPHRPGDIQILGQGAVYQLVVREFPPHSTPTHAAKLWGWAVSPPNHDSDYVPAELRPSWTNPFDPVDVNGDGQVSAIDALILINHINRVDPFDRNSPLPIPTKVGHHYLDPNRDERVTPIDVVIVINELNRRRADEG